MERAVNPRGGDIVLSVNAGSSSLKFALFRDENGEPCLVAKGAVEGIGADESRAWIQLREGTGQRGGDRIGPRADHAAAFETALNLLDEVKAPAPTLIGHRVVHGGIRYIKPTQIDSVVIDELKNLVSLAPLHMPAALDGIRAAAASYPALPQVACFDTAFHAAMPEFARRLPLPIRFDREGIRRYGFHGLSYEYILSTLGSPMPRRIVIAHLGNGSSLAAIRDGKPVDTTMGFTPTGGIMMGTRTGDLDPGVFLYLVRNANFSTDALEQLVDRESGLRAIGGTFDMKSLLARSETDPAAKLAVTMFCHGVRKAIGGLAAAIGGLDLLVFTGGIGEHAAPIRKNVCEGLEFIGIEIHAARNERGDDTISSDSSRCIVRVIKTDEDLMIARHTLALVERRSRHA